MNGKKGGVAGGVGGEDGGWGIVEWFKTGADNTLQTVSQQLGGRGHGGATLLGVGGRPGSYNDTSGAYTPSSGYYGGGGGGGCGFIQVNGTCRIETAGAAGGDGIIIIEW